MSPPISISVSIRPVRVGLRSTFSTVTSEPSTISAATIGKAAELGSPGTTITCGFRDWRRRRGGSARAPSSPGSISIAAPKAASMRSVWSRVGAGSMTVVVPGELSAASSTADFTCAEAPAGGTRSGSARPAP